MVRDLPGVGRNLFDHLNVPVYVNLRESVSITLAKLQTVAEVFNYLAFGTGKRGRVKRANDAAASIDASSRSRCVISPRVPFFPLHVKGGLATNGVMGLGRANNSGLLLFGVASTEEKLLKRISNFETEVNARRLS